MPYAQNGHSEICRPEQAKKYRYNSILLKRHASGEQAKHAKKILWFLRTAMIKFAVTE
jgi:hypothetical protein